MNPLLEPDVASSNPYPGFRPFGFDDEEIFFGREAHTNELLARLGRSRFLAVLGVSGSGKSSLVRAGLLPVLHGGFLGGSSEWRLAVLRPGSSPIANLARAIQRASSGGSGEADLQATSFYDRSQIVGRDLETRLVEVSLRRSALGLIEAVRHQKYGEGVKTLVVVDQFEELFRFRNEREVAGAVDEAEAFVGLLLEAARREGEPIYVILTMRSDFLGHCTAFRGLAEAVNDGQFLIPRMTRDEVRLAIAGPARVVGAELSERLVQRVLNDCGDDASRLPLLQHALMRTWDCWVEGGARGEVDVEHYEAIGGLDRAIAQHADEAYEGLDPQHRRVCERFFKAVTLRAPGSAAVRRPTAFGKLCEITGATPEAVATVLEAFRGEGSSFLLPTPREVPTPTSRPEAVIDLSHEALMRVWPILTAWVEEETESVRVFKRLVETARLHAAGRAPLYADPALQLALDWRNRSRPNQAWSRRSADEFEEAMDFLDESEARRAELARTKRDRHLRQLRLARMVGFGFGVVLGLAVATTAIGLWAVEFSREVATEATGHGARIKLYARQIEVGLLEARRSEKDFLLRWQRDLLAEGSAGFEAAEVKYADRVGEMLGEVEDALGPLRDEAEESIRSDEAESLLEAIEVIDHELDGYRAGFLAMRQGIEERARHDEGIYFGVRDAYRRIEGAIVALGATELAPFAHDYRVALAEVLLNESRVDDVEVAEAAHETLRKKIEHAAFAGDEGRALDDALTLCAERLASFSENGNRTRAAIEDLREHAHNIEAQVDVVKGWGQIELEATEALVEHHLSRQDRHALFVRIAMALVVVVGAALSVMLFRQLRKAARDTELELSPPRRS